MKCPLPSSVASAIHLEGLFVIFVGLWAVVEAR
jgi:hypothetical protein